MRGAQTEIIELARVSWAAGGRQTIPLKGLIQPAKRGLFPHVVGFIAEVADATPTLSSGSITPEGIQNIVRNIKVRDMFGATADLGFRHLRLLEALERGGRAASPDTDDVATTNAVSFARRLDSLPSVMAGAPRDGAAPLPFYDGGTIDVEFGSLAQLHANATAFAATLIISAVVVYRPDVILPVRVERGQQGFTNRRLQLDGNALYLFLGLLDSDDAGAIGAGDFGTIVLSDAGGSRKALDAESYTVAYEQDMGVGQISMVAGEPRNATTHDNAKRLDGTAVEAAIAAVQPVVWCPDGTRLTQVCVEARPMLEVNIREGSQTTGHAIFTRVLPVSQEMRTAQKAAAIAGYGVNLGGDKFATLDKADYRGSRAPFLPIKLKPM